MPLGQSKYSPFVPAVALPLMFTTPRTVSLLAAAPVNCVGAAASVVVPKFSTDTARSAPFRSIEWPGRIVTLSNWLGCVLSGGVGVHTVVSFQLPDFVETYST